MRNWLAYFLIDAGALDVQMRKWQEKDEGVDIGEEEKGKNRTEKVFHYKSGRIRRKGN